MMAKIIERIIVDNRLNTDYEYYKSKRILYKKLSFCCVIALVAYNHFYSILARLVSSMIVEMLIILIVGATFIVIFRLIQLQVASSHWKRLNLPSSIYPGNFRLELSETQTQDLSFAPPIVPYSPFFRSVKKIFKSLYSSE
jgi:hypothetical protein